MVRLQQGFANGEMGFRGRFAQQQSQVAHVRFGSKANIGARPNNVRFTPESGHGLSVSGCPLCAKSGSAPGGVRALCADEDGLVGTDKLSREKRAACRRPWPLFLRKQTWFIKVPMSALCQKQTTNGDASVLVAFCRSTNRYLIGKGALDTSPQSSRSSQRYAAWRLRLAKPVQPAVCIED